MNDSIIGLKLKIHPHTGLPIINFAQRFSLQTELLIIKLICIELLFVHGTNGFPHFVV